MITCGVIAVRASISKPTLVIFLAFEITDPFIYLIIQNFDLSIYCPFFIPIFASSYTNIAFSKINTKRTSILGKISERKKKYAYTWMSETLGLSHTNQEKSGPVIYILLKKRGLITYWQRRKGGPFDTHIRTMPYTVYIGSYHYHPPPPPPPTPIPSV